MQHISKSDLIAARAALSGADANLSRARGVFIKAGYAPGAAAVNALIDRVSHLLVRIDRALAAKP
jgi:hypothetical protein